VVIKLASEAVAKTYNFKDGKYWYDMFKGTKGSKEGLEYHIGGSKVFNYADALSYTDKYKSVYDQISTYLVELNLCNFNQTCKAGVLPYEDAVNWYFLKSINDIEVSKKDTVSYADNKTTVMANGDWNITFNSGSSEINRSSTKDLESIYNLLVQAENTKINVIGFTDNVGSPNANLVLSKNRAQSVVNYLIDKGIQTERFQLIDGKGQNEPVADNNTVIGKAHNRRVQITFLK
jgi:outer membrane protein OmpA-like peptidoglycan-associated protein